MYGGDLTAGKGEMNPSDTNRNNFSNGAPRSTGRSEHIGEPPLQDDRWVRSVLEHSSENVTVVDPDGTLRYASPAFGRMLGHNPEEVVGKMNVLDLVHPDDLPRVLEETVEALAEGGVVTNKVEYRFRHKDGSWRWVESVGTYLLDDPTVNGVVVQTRDVTERKEAEEEKVKLARRATLRADISAALAGGGPLRDILQRCTEAMVRHLGAAFARIWTLDEGKDVLELRASAGMYTHTDGFHGRVPLGSFKIGLIAQARLPHLTNDVSGDPRVHDKGWAEREGMVAFAGYPLLVEGKVVGVVALFARHTFSEDTTEVLASVADAIAQGIQRKWTESALQAGEERFRSLVQNASDTITILDADGVVRYVSPAVERMLGHRPEELTGIRMFGLVHPDDVERASGSFDEVLGKPGSSSPLEFRAPHKDGSWRHMEATLTNLLDDPGVSGVVVNARDTTERNEAEGRLREAEERYRTLVERIPAIVYVQEPDEPSRTTYVSPQNEAILGYSPEECIVDPDHWIKIMHPNDRERVLTEDRRNNESGDTFGVEYRQFAKDGRTVWIRDEGTLVRDEGGQPLYWLGVQTDITQRKALEEELRHQAFHDLLTMLPNRALYVDRLTQALARIDRRDAMVAVLFMDLDNFKVINDSLGHDIGDLLLIAVAERLKGCLRSEDTLARWGGDEFTVLIEDVTGPSDVARVANRIVEELSKPFTVGGREVHTSASIGISLGASDVAIADELLRNADTAMYRAKEETASYRMFESNMYEQARRRLELESDLRGAIENEEFVIHYQPKVSLRTGKIVDMEALVRWQHPVRGLLSPSEFITAAEETGLIVPLGRWVISEACRQVRRWQDRYPGGSAPRVSVNLSARQFQNPDLAEEVAEALRESNLTPFGLELEITETVVMGDAPSTIATLRELKNLGVMVAIDDFGTGHSSLSYLKRFRVDSLKIDGSFVAGLGKDAEDEVIVSGVISLAHGLGLTVVAEGVETEAQKTMIGEMGCDFAQGYLFSRPLTPEAASEFLAN